MDRKSVEDVVYGAWREVLGLAEVHSQENFFDSGGTSILAARLAARLGSRLGTPICARDIFLFPTIHALTTHICGEPATQTSPCVPRASAQRHAFDRLRATAQSSRSGA